MQRNLAGEWLPRPATDYARILATSSILEERETDTNNETRNHFRHHIRR